MTHRRARPAPGGRPRGPRGPVDALHPARAPGRARVAAGHHRPDRDLALLLAVRGELPHLGQHHQPHAPDHRRRHRRHRRGAGAAAGRDRPLGRRRQRPRGVHHGGAEHQERLGRVGRHPGGDPGGVRDRALPGLVRHLLPGALVRRDPGGSPRLPGRAALCARRHRHDQPQRQHHRGPGQHVLFRLRGLDHRRGDPGAIRAPDALGLPATSRGGARDRALPPARDPHGRRDHRRRWRPWPS